MVSSATPHVVNKDNTHIHLLKSFQMTVGGGEPWQCKTGRFYVLARRGKHG
jgi:hypothetical protein